MQDGLVPTQSRGWGLLVTALPGDEEAARLVACGEDEAQPRPRAVATTKGFDQLFQPLGVVAHGGERRLTEPTRRARDEPIYGSEAPRFEWRPVTHELEVERGILEVICQAFGPELVAQPHVAPPVGGKCAGRGILGAS